MDLPQPLSPTIPSVDAASRTMLTPRRARTGGPRLEGYSFTTSVALMISSAIRPGPSSKRRTSQGPGRAGAAPLLRNVPPGTGTGDGTDSRAPGG